MSDGTISIIVPVYQGAEYLESLADRLAAQSVREYEVLFVDDGSLDRSGEILARLAGSDPRIRYLRHDANRGQGAARNSGLENASGEYVMYIDADDSFAPDYLEKMRAAIERDKADLAICNSVWVYPQRRETHNMFLARPRTSYRLLPGREALGRYFQIYETDMWIPVEPWGKIVRRSFLEQHKIRHKETLFEDVVMTFNELALAGKVACIADPLYWYNKTNNRAATIERQRQYVREIYRVPEGVLEVATRYGLCELREYLTLFYFRYINGAYSFFAKGERLREELEYTLGRYRGLLDKPEFGQRTQYVLQQLQGFYSEMKSHGFPELFTYFVEPHREQIDGLLMESLGSVNGGGGLRRLVHQARGALRWVLSHFGNHGLVF